MFPRLRSLRGPVVPLFRVTIFSQPPRNRGLHTPRPRVELPRAGKTGYDDDYKAVAQREHRIFLLTGRDDSHLVPLFFRSCNYQPFSSQFIRSDATCHLIRTANNPPKRNISLYFRRRIGSHRGLLRMTRTEKAVPGRNARFIRAEKLRAVICDV